MSESAYCYSVETKKIRNSNIIRTVIEVESIFFSTQEFLDEFSLLIEKHIKINK